jgi:DMSO/TMAO reductase YedYZ heme-binding membrane subunit
MKLYLQTIQLLQKVFLGVSIGIMLILPVILSFYTEALSEATITHLYDASHLAVFFVMSIRPLADIFITSKFIRPLVILRKGVGVFSASLIMSVIFSKIIIDAGGYFGAFGTLEYWSLRNYALLAHLADISAFILLITSNNLSKRLLGAGWKKVQKLSYVFFYASSLYVYLSYGHLSVLVSLFVVTALTLLAYRLNKKRRASVVISS